MIELHALSVLNDEAFATMAARAISTLTAHHAVVHVHANNHAPWTRVGGLDVPVVIELTLVRRDAYDLTESAEHFPTPLDMPNNAARADHDLGRFHF